MTEPRYILLAEGEKIQEGDEFYNVRLKQWTVCISACIGVGTAGDAYPVRRRLEGWREIGNEVIPVGIAILHNIHNDTFTFVREMILNPHHWTHYLACPPLPVKQSEADIAWAEYAQSAKADIADRIERKAFIAGFEAGRKK